MMIPQVYAAITDAEEKADKFYYQVQSEHIGKRKQNVPLKIGDWNHKVGIVKERNIDGLYGLENQNEAQKQLKNSIIPVTSS